MSETGQGLPYADDRLDKVLMTTTLCYPDDPTGGAGGLRKKRSPLPIRSRTVALLTSIVRLIDDRSPP